MGESKEGALLIFWRRGEEVELAYLVCGGMEGPERLLADLTYLWRG